MSLNFQVSKKRNEKITTYCFVIFLEGFDCVFMASVYFLGISRRVTICQNRSHFTIACLFELKLVTGP